MQGRRQFFFSLGALTFTTYYKQLYAVAIYNLQKQMPKFGGASAPLSTHLSTALKWEPQKVCTFTVLLSTYYEVKILIIAKPVQAALLYTAAILGPNIATI